MEQQSTFKFQQPA